MNYKWETFQICTIATHVHKKHRNSAPEIYTQLCFWYSGIWPCGVITLIRELFTAESKGQVYGHLHQFLHTHSGTASNLRKLCTIVLITCWLNGRVFFCAYVNKKSNIDIGYICYDDSCHLKKYAMNPCRKELTFITKILSEMNITIDKMHIAGHVDVWWKRSCDPALYPELEKVSINLM